MVATGAMIGLIMPFISIMVAVTAFYGSRGTIDYLEKRRYQELKTKEDSLVDSGYSRRAARQLNAMHALYEKEDQRTEMKDLSGHAATDFSIMNLESKNADIKRIQRDVVDIKRKIEMLQNIILHTRGEMYSPPTEPKTATESEASSASLPSPSLSGSESRL